MDRLKDDIHQRQREAFLKIGAVEQQVEVNSAEASRGSEASDLRMSGVQDGLGEHERDILRLREEVNKLIGESASHEVDALARRNHDDLKITQKSLIGG